MKIMTQDNQFLNLELEATSVALEQKQMACEGCGASEAESVDGPMVSYGDSFMSVDLLSKSIAKKRGGVGAAFALEFLHVKTWIFHQARLERLKLYEADKPSLFLFDGLYEAHGELRLTVADAAVVWNRILDIDFANQQQKSSSLESQLTKSDAHEASSVDGAGIAPVRARRDLLTPVIEAAQKECGNGYDAPAIWAVMVRMAQEGKCPLVGQTEEGIKWIDSNDAPQIFTLKNLRDRLGRLTRERGPRRDKAR